MFLGRALAAPRVKLMEDPYQHPELQFFPLRKGPRAAGELIATFELIELDYSSGLEVRVLGSSWDTPWTTPAIPPGPLALGMWAHPRVTPPTSVPPENAGCRSVLGPPHCTSRLQGILEVDLPSVHLARPPTPEDPGYGSIPLLRHPSSPCTWLFLTQPPPANLALPGSSGFISHQQSSVCLP